MKFYDVWSLHPGNLIAEHETEAEALATVRDLLASGWSVDDLSVGWGDRYPWDIAYQYVNISGLAPGNYRLTVTADAQSIFRESNDGNNFTYTDLYIARPGYSSRILGYGPSA